MQLRGVKITRFRGIKELRWFPNPGMNALVGPGDVGKTTVLEAIAMVLSPAPAWVASEHDYYQGDTAIPFSVELVIGSLNDDVLRSWSVAPIWGWNATAHTLSANPEEVTHEGVIRVGVQGSSELEVSHYATDPSGGELPFSVSTRRKFGLSTLGSPLTAY
jgi:putative ATP-dependent endonuclease of OLD family